VVGRRILLTLLLQELPVHEIVLRTGLPQSSVYRKLGELESAGLVRVSRLAFTREGRKIELYRSRVKEIRIRLAPEGLGIYLVADDSSDRLESVWEQVRRFGR
jgi:DNA-binding transcriptional ArsR family regulator